MAINTNLNIAPYFDDFDAEKQYVRVLFKPARAVQARELTTLQSILQNQIERFGNNIFQEGTIIEGVNPTTETGVRYIKVNDQAGLDNMNQYASTEDTPIFVRGLSSGLRAKVIAGANGFQTRDPDLKTLFVKYLKSAPGATVNDAELKYFQKGELLQIENADGEEIITVTASSTDEYQGLSYAVSVTDGVIYQRGLFNYVEPQLVIVSKYTNQPNDISVGFDIEEAIIDSGLDSSLLDNAQGYNNQNAPGADRLKLTPKLKAYTTATRPANFFTLVRLENGAPVYIRGDTQFNSISKELAKRTEDESGSYVVSGLEVSTEVDENGSLNAVIGAGKAYAFGYEVNVLNNKRVPIEPVTVSNSKTQQSTGVTYGSYFEVDVNAVNNEILEDFNFTDRYNLWDNTGANSGAGNVIGKCSIRNIEPRGTDTVRIYVYAVVKESAYTNTPIAFIGNASSPTPIKNNKIVRANAASALFDTGRAGMKAASEVVFVEKKRRLVTNFDTANPVVNIEVQTNGDVTTTPLTSGIYGVSTNNEYVPLDGAAVAQFTDNQLTQVQVTFDVGSPAKTVEYVYYDATVTGQSQDTLQEVDVWVQTTFNFTASQNFGPLGLPNVVKLKQVLDEDDNDITSKFRLENNAKDGYYDLSYIRAKAGETVDNAETLKVNVVALKRTYTGTSKFLSINSYANVSNLSEYILPYTAKNGRTYNPLNCFDFRPYATPSTQYSQNKANPPVVPSSTTLTLNPTIPISNDKSILSTHEYYLSRIDKLAIDKDQEFVIVKGQPADNPGKVVNNSFFGIADIYVPGNIISKTGLNAIKVERNTTKNYTMKDIKGIEKRVDRMFDILSLSLLEQETKDLFIPDANGLNRFKNGILVEQFKDVAIADMQDPEYKASIERGQTILAPALTQFPVDLKIESISSENTTTFADITTKDASATPETLVNQEYATTFRNCASNFYRYNGKISMFPRFDAEYDVTENPAVTLNVDLATPLLDFVDNLQEFVPLTNTAFLGSEVTGATRREGNFRVTPILNSFQDTFMTNSIYNQQQDLGTYLTDFSIQPYMSSKTIRIAVAGLRPNTRHYFYFDETPISQYVQPGGIIAEDIVNESIVASDVFATGAQGTAVSSDEYGRLYAVFNLPPQTFFVGDAELLVVDTDQYASVESASTSRARDRYRAYNFAMNTTTIGSDVRSVDFDTAQSDIYTQAGEIRVFDPPPPPDDGGPDTSCFVAGTLVTMGDGTKKRIEEVLVGDQLLGQDGEVNTVQQFDHWQLDGRDLIGINGSGPFKTPEHPLMTKDGWKAFNSQDTIEQKPQIAHLMTNGNLEVGDEILMEDGTWVRIDSLSVHSNQPQQTVYNFVLDGNHTYYADGILAHNRDPLSQTFSIQPPQAEYATSLFVPKIDLWFKQKSPADRRNGITVQIRETFNGYPTSQLLPFASKHVDWDQIQVSDDASAATTITFDNPVKLKVGKDYCVVIEPDAIDPDYFIWTAKVGENDISDSSVQVTSDWGQGVLFTSTDNKAWLSYQNEDIKFKLYKQPFSTDSAHVDLVPNDMEFFTISGNTGRFRNDEYAYAETTNVYDGTLTANKKISTPLGGDFLIQQGDMVVVKQQNTAHVSTVKTLVDDGTNRILTLTDAPILTTGAVTITLAIGGKVAYFNAAKPTRMHIKQSTSRSGLLYTLGGTQSIRGALSNATARIETLFNAPVSYFQPFIMQENTMRTSTDLTLYKQTGAADDAANNPGEGIGFYSSNFLNGAPRYIPSKQLILGDPDLSVDRFRFRLGMENGTSRFVTPVLDNQLSTMQVYEYAIDDVEANSSKYISKKVVLQPDYPAEGLRFIMAAYRPAGTMIDVYARFTYPSDPDGISDWIQLENQSPDLFSTTANIRDYRDFEYALASEDEEYDAFQIKIVLRHATDDELNDLNLSDEITRAENLYPHVYDYRAIALT